MQASQIELQPAYSLVETILWEHCCGYWLLPEHLDRLQASAFCLTRSYDPARLEEQLNEVTRELPPRPHLVRVEINAAGEASLSVQSSSQDRAPVRAGLASSPVDAGNPLLYHQTTDRRIYEKACAGVAGYEEILLWNEKGELTESCTANLLCERDGQYVTPPLSCGLLPGTYRASLLRERPYIQRPISIEELPDFTRVFLINSEVGWREVSNWGGGRRGE